MSDSRGVRRREFLEAAVGGAALAGLGGCGKAAERAPALTTHRDRPNILVIMSDEHDPAITGCYGNRLVQTPHLDRLAARGVTFENAYTNSPLCVPARLSFTAGKYVSRIGAWSNNCWIPAGDGVPSIARAMTDAGYDSLLCGKQHYDATRRYGFTEIGGNMNRSRKTGRGSRRAADDERINTRNRDQRFAQFHTGRTSGVMAHDQKVTAGVLEFFEKRGRGEKPFFLFAGYLAPHFPLIVPEPLWKPYEGRIPMPELPPGHVASQPLNYQHLRRGFGVVETDPKTVRLGRELYYGLTQWIDREIGKVLAALERSGLADRTVVIYTADHGENLGEHHLWWKNCMYEHAAHVPLIISWPERWKGGTRRAGACAHVDLVKTVADLGGARVPDDWNGDALCRWLDDAAAPWKDLAVSEYYAHNIASGYAMLRQGGHKYVYHTPADAKHPAERELYDLAADPKEFTNLAGQPEQKTRIEAMHAALVKELGRHPDETERLCRADYAKGYGRQPAGKKRKKKA